MDWCLKVPQVLSIAEWFKSYLLCSFWNFHQTFTSFSATTSSIEPQLSFTSHFHELFSILEQKYRYFLVHDLHFFVHTTTINAHSFVFIHCQGNFLYYSKSKSRYYPNFCLNYSVRSPFCLRCPSIIWWSLSISVFWVFKTSSASDFFMLRDESCC